MTIIQRSALVPHSAQQMFDLINDISTYPEFMPGCIGTEILGTSENTIVARLDLKKSGIKQSFTTKNILYPPHRVDLTLVDGPFKHFTGEWRFETLSESACKVAFCLEFRFKNKLLEMAAGRAFEKIASDQVETFCQRAKAIYPKD